MHGHLCEFVCVAAGDEALNDDALPAGVLLEHDAQRPRQDDIQDLAGLSELPAFARDMEFTGRLMT